MLAVVVDENSEWGKKNHIFKLQTMSIKNKNPQSLPGFKLKGCLNCFQQLISIELRRSGTTHSNISLIQCLLSFYNSAVYYCYFII